MKPPYFKKTLQERMKAFNAAEIRIIFYNKYYKYNISQLGRCEIVN